MHLFRYSYPGLLYWLFLTYIYFVVLVTVACRLGHVKNFIDWLILRRPIHKNFEQYSYYELTGRNSAHVSIA